MPSAPVRIAVSVVLTALAFAWLYESYTCGRCFVSVYIAPVVVFGNGVLAVWQILLNRRQSALPWTQHRRIDDESKARHS
jgi:hypothetical protein